MKRIKLLLLSGGSLVGRNILDCLCQRRSFVELIALNSVAKEPSLFEYDKVYLSPPLDQKPQEFRKCFNEIIEIEKPDLIIPCRDEDVTFLSKFKAKNPFSTFRFLSGSDFIANSFLDKWLSWKFSKILELPFTPTLNSDASPQSTKAFLETEDLPLIAKPRKGFGSLGVFLITKETQLKQVLKRSDYVIQRYLGNFDPVAQYLINLADSGIPLFHSFEEIKISVQAIIGPDGEFERIFITEHIMKQGISVMVNICDDEKLHQLAIKWVIKISEAGWVGPINIQCQRDPSGRVLIYEYNGRFTGATSARFWLGFDEVGMTLKLWLGANLPFDFNEGVYHSVIRVPGSKPINMENVRKLTDSKIWENPLFAKITQ